MKYAVIGNSAAAVGCIEGIRTADKTGEIVVISEEPHHTYSRPLISYLLMGKTDLSRMKYRPDSFYEDNGVTPLFGRRATGVDVRAKKVTLEGGGAVGYDKLLYAAGSRAFVPAVRGLETVKNRFTFLTLDDALALERTLTKQTDVLIAGAGLIGLKCMEGVLARVKSVTVVDPAPRVLSSVLDGECAARVRQYLEEKGVRFALADSVEVFDKDQALLQSGRTIRFDVLVMAAGVRPNTELLEKAGAKTDKGVITDERMQTSLQDVYAAGDCTVSRDVSTGAARVLALLPNAYRQGLCAGKNMAGEKAVFDGAIPMNAVGFFGYHILSAGTCAGAQRVFQTQRTYKKLYTEDGLLKGFVMMGDCAGAGVYTALIRDRTPLEEIDFDLICQRPSLAAFSAQARKTRLAVPR